MFNIKRKQLSTKIVVFIFYSSLVFCSAFIFSCAPQEKKSIKRIPSDYTSWKLSTEKKLDYPIPGHENRFRIPYINAIGLDFTSKLINGKNRIEFPEGTIIAKDIYANNPPLANEKPVFATIMLKASGDSEAMGGWLWIMRDSATQEETIVKNRFCLNCHANANEAHPYADGNVNEEFRDYVFFVPGLDTKIENEYDENYN